MGDQGGADVPFGDVVAKPAYEDELACLYDLVDFFIELDVSECDQFAVGVDA